MEYPNRKAGWSVRSLYLLLLLIPPVIFGAMSKVNANPYFPKAERPQNIYAIHANSMSQAEKLAVVSLQGVLAQTLPQIYITGNDSYREWLDTLKGEGVPIQVNEDPWWYFSFFAPKLKSKEFILAKVGTPSVNAATALSGMMGLPVIDVSIRAKAEKLGYRLAFDATDKTAEWVFDNYKDRLNPNLLFRQDPSKIELRDYAILCKAFVFYGENTKFIKKVMAWAKDDSPLFGWGPGGEDNHVGLGSSNGLFTVPSDWAMNISVLSAFGYPSLKQKKAISSQPKATDQEEKVHYVAFAMTDGDNVQWLLGGMYHDKRWYGSPFRGRFPMAWTISPSLIDLAGTAMKRYYDTALDDTFIAGVSGIGYMYPKSNPAIKEHVANLAEYMKRTDLSIAAVMDFGSVKAKSLQPSLDLYSKIPALKGGIYVNYSDYAGDKGSIVWANGKPFVTAREKLWESDPAAFAKKLNSYPKDPKSAKGYSLVWVHCWSHSLESVQQVIDNLDPNVKVIGLNEFFDKVIQNLRPSE